MLVPCRVHVVPQENGDSEPVVEVRDPILLGKMGAFHAATRARNGIAENAVPDIIGGGGTSNGNGDGVDAARTASSSKPADLRPSAWTSRKHTLSTTPAAVDAAAATVEANHRDPTRGARATNRDYLGSVMKDLATTVEAVISGKADISNSPSSGRRSVKVGGATGGPLRSRDDDAEIWLGVDGSIFHRKISAVSSTDGGHEAPGSAHSTMLIGTDVQKVAEVFDRRYDLMAEKERQRGGKESKRRRKWMPWCRQAKAERRAKENAGRVEMAVDNRGGVVSWCSFFLFFLFGGGVAQQMVAVW